MGDDNVNPFGDLEPLANKEEEEEDDEKSDSELKSDSDFKNDMERMVHLDDIDQVFKENVNNIGQIESLGKNHREMLSQLNY